MSAVSTLLNVRIRSRDPLRYIDGIPTMMLELRPNDHESLGIMRPDHGEAYVRVEGQLALDIAHRGAYRGRALLSADGTRLAAFHRFGERISLADARETLVTNRAAYVDMPAIVNQFDTLLRGIDSLEKHGADHISLDEHDLKDWHAAIYGTPTWLNLSELSAEVEAAIEESRESLHQIADLPESDPRIQMREYYEMQLDDNLALAGRIEDLRNANVSQVFGRRNNLVDALTIAEHDTDLEQSKNAQSEISTLLRKAEVDLAARGIRGMRVLIGDALPHGRVTGIVAATNDHNAVLHMGGGGVLVLHMDSRDPNGVYARGDTVVLNDCRIDRDATAERRARQHDAVREVA